MTCFKGTLCENLSSLYFFGFLELGGGSTCLLGNLRRSAWGITKTCEESGEGEEKKKIEAILFMREGYAPE